MRMIVFKTPLPNSALWNGPTIGTLSNQDAFTDGGWWHDNRILAATGEGIEKEEPRAWEGWWNEKIVELVRLSMKQPDALCVLLTGRSEQGFGDLVRRIVESKGLEFDMVSLKPKVSPTNQRFSSTMHFKQLFLNALMETYRNAEELRIYEDRPKHTKGFRDFFEEWNARQRASPTRGPLTAEVVQVAEIQATLDPVTEVAEVQRMINAHNEAVAISGGKRLAIKKTVFFTCYKIDPADTQRLRKLAQVPSNIPSHELMHHGNQILICPRPASPNLLEKVGGMGSKMRWEVTSIGSHENNVWAAGLRPIPSTATYHTANPVPLVVLTLRKGTRPIEASKISKWYSLSPEQMFTFETTVGEKNLLRVETEDPSEGEYESLFANHKAPSKRKFPGEEERAPPTQPKDHHHNNNNNHHQQHSRPGQSNGQSRGFHTGGGGGRGGRGRGGNGAGGGGGRGFRGNRGGGRGGGKGRGGGNYRSLDDVDPKRSQGGGAPTGGNAAGQGAGSSADLATYY